MKKVSTTQSAKLYELEEKALRWVNGEFPLEPWGAWIGACLGRLARMGYVTPYPYSLTEKGRAYLESNDA